MKYAIFLSIIVLTILFLPTISLAKGEALTILGIDLKCEPEKSPRDGGCGINHFAILLQKAINFLTISIALPIGVLMFVWAGFVIMTAGGSREKVAKGKKIINVAIMGIVIVLLAAAIVGVINSIIIG